MTARRRITASSLGKKHSKGGIFYIITLGIIFWGFYIFLNYLQDLSTGEAGKEKKEKIEKLTKKIGFDDKFYKTFFVPRPLYYKAMGLDLKITATNFGVEYWNTTFPSIIAEAEIETKDLLLYEKEINRVIKGTRKTVSLKDMPLLYNVIKKGKSYAQKTNYNIMSGDIDIIWRRSLAIAKDVKNLEKNKKLYEEKLQNSIEDLSKKEQKDIKKKLKNIKRLISKTSVLPDMKNLKDFIPFAKPGFLKLDDQEKSITITEVNTSINLKFLKEALFLSILKKKLPDDMQYLIYLGNRHGIWKLDEKFVRWTVSIDNPFEVLDNERGAIQLVDKEGAFVITRRKEDYFMFLMEKESLRLKNLMDSAKSSEEKKKIFINYRKKYDSKKYLIDVAEQKIFKLYDIPVNWKTALPANKNMAAIVLHDNPIDARMLSYALFVSDEKDVQKVVKQFPTLDFLILKNDDTVYYPEHVKNMYVSKEKIKELRKKQKKNVEQRAFSKEEIQQMIEKEKAQEKGSDQ